MRGSSGGQTRALYCLLGGDEFWGGGCVVVGVWSYRGLN